MNFIQIDIPPSGVHKRDCELIDFALFPSIYLKLKKDSDQTKWQLFFDDYFALKIVTEEFAIHLIGKGIPNEGSFYLVEDSTWIQELAKTKNPSLGSAKHYLLFLR